MDVEDPAEVARDLERKIDDRRELLDRFFKACREVCREHTYETAATELEREWGDLGRHVSSGILKMSLAPGNERNYFRWEWCMWFAEQSEDVSDLLCEIAGRGMPKKPPEEELEDLKSIVRVHYPKDAEKHLRKAATPRRRR